jgi:hypothetical protein
MGHFQLNGWTWEWETSTLLFFSESTTGAKLDFSCLAAAFKNSAQACDACLCHCGG